MSIGAGSVIESSSEEETFEIGKSMGERAHAGDIYLLEGDLGAGKTVFAKGFAAGLGIEETVTSPTFTIVQEYEGRLPLYHFDTYRISDPDEMLDIGFEEYLYGNGVCLIEWPSRVEEWLPNNVTKVEIEYLKEYGDKKRKIMVRNNNNKIRTKEPRL